MVIRSKTVMNGMNGQKNAKKRLHLQKEEINHGRKTIHNYR